MLDITTKNNQQQSIINFFKNHTKKLALELQKQKTIKIKHIDSCKSANLAKMDNGNYY